MCLGCLAVRAESPAPPLHPSAVSKDEILQGNVLVVPTALSRGRSVLCSSNKIDKQITLEFPKLP